MYVFMVGEANWPFEAKSKKCTNSDVACFFPCSFAHIAMTSITQEFSFGKNVPSTDELCLIAAQTGEYEVLKLGLWSQITCAELARQGHFEVLRWAREQGCPWDETTCSNASIAGRLDILKWARSNGCPWNEWTCTQAAIRGNLRILKWARSNGCPWNGTVCDYAALGCHLDVLKWAHTNGCPWGANTLMNAVGKGNLEIVRWLDKKGCPWKPQLTCLKAVLSNKIELIRWVVSKGVLVDWREIFEVASMNGNADALRFGFKEKLIDECKLYLDIGVTNSHLQVIKVIHERCKDKGGIGSIWDEKTCEKLYLFGDLSVMLWINRNASDRFYETLTMAANKGHISFVRMAAYNGMITKKWILDYRKNGKDEIVKKWFDDILTSTCIEAIFH